MDAKIQMEVWAGALGVPVLRKVVDAAQLSAEKSTELDQLVSASGVLRLPAVPAPATKVRDSNQTKFVFDFGGKTQTVRVPEEAVSGHLRTLIDFLKDHGV